MSTTLDTAPRTFEDLGVKRSLLEDLALKMIYLRGEMSVQELSEDMKVTMGIAEDLFRRLRKDMLCEVTGMIGTVHRVTTTSGGKTRALELLTLNQYAGPAPVSLNDYVDRVRSQSVRSVVVGPEEMVRGFRHLVVEQELLDQLGTALNSGRAIFLYGPTGTGKTTIAETLAHIMHKDDIWLPYAVEVDGQIITIFDEHTHQRVENGKAEHDMDRRWVMCKRPRVLVGGELSMEMLDLQFNPLTKYYSGPLQMKANNGMLIVDDFGRQRMRPSELLNRWVVPLDRHIDFLTMTGGRKVQIPFDLVVVFATNLDPAKMVDEAFLRRIQTKIKVDFVTPEQFHDIFFMVCDEFGVGYERKVVDQLLQMLKDELKQPLRGCFPRDLVQQVIWAAKYNGSKPALTEESIRTACRTYFLSQA